MERLFKAGDIIISEGAIEHSAYIIQSGKVEVFLSKDGRHISLGILDKGQIFGEMALIDEKPRSANIKAVDDVKAREISREEFNRLLKVDPAILIPIIKALFERLRTANINITEKSCMTSESVPEINGKKVFMKGTGELAIESLKNETMEIPKFPFKVGRKVKDINDTLSNNDLYLDDHEPYNVSRNHFAIHSVERKILIVDRGSTLGTIVNGVQIGKGGSICEAELKEGNNELIAGLHDSPFKFIITVMNK